MRPDGAPMICSEHRILTTHTGSLPRPAELTRLYAMRVRGQAVDAAAIEAAGKAAVRAIVPRQIEAGIDVINNGEQQRESFVLYLQRPPERPRRQRARGRCRRTSTTIPPSSARAQS